MYFGIEKRFLPPNLLEACLMISYVCTYMIQNMYVYYHKVGNKVIKNSSE